MDLRYKRETMKRILIDGRFIGVGDSQTRLVMELVKGILKLDKENDYTLLVRPQAKAQISNLDSEEYRNLSIKMLDIKHYGIAEQTKLLKYLKEEKFDLVHFTQFNHPIRYRGNYVITIQDMTLFGHLHRQNIVKKLAFGSVIKSAAKNSTKIICISKTTMEEVASYFNIPKDKFTVTYLGIDHQNYNMNVKSRSEEIDKFEKKYHIAEEYILYTGMWKRHKNILRMLKAFEKFKTQNVDNKIQLVLVGKVDKSEPEVMKEITRINLTINDAIIVTGYIDEIELPIAYAGAFAYCMPSLSEGFGWPPLEAMACGTPVISSHESCMPEILGKAPLYFDAYNVDDIAKKMETIISDKELRKELIKKGLEQVKKYNWDECAEKTFKVYKELLDGQD